MYFKDGFICGGEPEGEMKIREVKALQDQILILTFENGEQRLFDASVLKGPVFSALRNERVFETVKLDHGVVTWLDGEIDCAPEYMYDHSYEYKAADFLTLV